MEKTLVINTGKCAWGKCVFCGWGKREFRKKGIRELKELIDTEVKPGIKTLKIFCSGSFLDDEQIPRVFRRYLVKKCEDAGIENLIVESRPEFVAPENLSEMKSEKVKVTVAIGLEVADDKILEKLKKGFRVDDYLRAVETLREHGFGVRTYILVNAPYTDVNTLKKSVELAKKHSDSVCLINCYPHSDSEVFKLWLEGKWRPLDRKEFEKIVSRFKDVETDFSNMMFLPRFPRELRKPIRGVGKDKLLHPFYEVWQDYICRFYEVPENRKRVLFVPCTFTKPYSKSKLHRKILRVVPKDVHLVVISSPGVIPYEFINMYPFNSYDWPEWEETEEIKKLYIQVTKKRIKNYLRAHRYSEYFSYLRPDSESFKALKDACDELGIHLVSCVSRETWEKIKDRKNPLASDEAIADLKRFFSFEEE
ncbi:MAG: radical SAM protein [Candidatus Micrarchaeota archaeon]|nr:radical SAM protein [Candidatus Micrarchaeota archaeon]